MRSTRSLLAHCAASAACWATLLCAPAAAAGKVDLKVGDGPPDVFGKSAGGESIHLADYRGKIVVISFWASWCGPCRKELPVLVSLQQHATRDKLVVLSVNWRQPYEEFREIRRVLGKLDTVITLISDEHGRAGNAYGVEGIPHMVIVGRDGRIAAIHVGYSEAQIPLLVDEINSAWNKPAAVTATAD